VREWKAQLTNDFENLVFAAHPAIKNIRDELYASGAVYASLSGSGSCVFGIFNNDTEFRSDQISGEHKVYLLKHNR
jgi:4-diphosphocytidyl-2-C-methyl-D-erythritol kinase